MMSHTARSLLLIVTACLAIGTLPGVLADEGELIGIVSDEQGAPLPGASVALTNPGRAEFLMTATTDEGGSFSFVVRPIENPYRLVVTLAGHLPLESDFEFEAGTSKKMAIQLPSLESAPVIPGAVKAYNEGVKLEEDGSLEAAIAAYRRALEIQPSLAPALYALARGLEQQGEHREALEWIGRFLKLEPKDGSGLMVQVRAAKGAGDFERALASAEALSGSAEGSSLAAEFNNDAVALTGERDLAGAAALYRLALALDPRRVEARLNLAAVVFALGRVEQAAELASQVLEQSPEQPAALRLSYISLAVLGRTEVGSRAFARLLSTSGDREAAAAALQVADILEKRGQARAAIDSLAAIVDQVPGSAPVHHALGMLYLRQGLLDDAKTHLQQSADLAPDSEDAALARELLQSIGGGD